jgi:[acyl-carrier-protein] S-malonyltransferase
MPPQPGWRNRQTRGPQKPQSFGACGFESRSGHHCATLAHSTTVPWIRRRDASRGAAGIGDTPVHPCHTAPVAGIDLVLAFPGQGSLVPGVGAPWRAHPSFAVIEDVAVLAGIDVGELLVSGGEAELVATDNAQLATFALSLCILEATGLAATARYALGHSLGEYTALVAAGMLDRSDGTTLVAARGHAMQAAAVANPGGLVAAIGGDAALADKATEMLPGLAVANYNGPGQVVFGGSTAVLDEFVERVKELGFRRAIPLKVGGAFHTALMAPAADALGPALQAATFRAGHAVVVANVDGAAHPEPSDWTSLLLRQLTQPVRFEDCVRALPSESTIVECGPGKVIQGLIKRIRDDVVVHGVGEPDDLSSLPVAP